MGEEREPSMRNRTLLRSCAVFVRILRTLSGRKYRHCRRTAVSWKSGRVLCRHHGTFPRMEHTYLTYMRQSVLGSLMQYGVPFFYAADMMTASSFLAAKIAVCRATPARRPCRAGCLEKNHPRFAPVFFPSKPCAIMAKSKPGHIRNGNTGFCQAGHV